MSVSYAKLREIMIKYKIQHEAMRKATGCTTSEIAKINKDEYMTLQSLERITRYLTQIVKHRVKVDDILTFLDDS
jgi:DNA-binding Xre family transcriptional regulator